MRFIAIFLLMMSGVTFAQPLTLLLDSISSKDKTDKERIFTVHYSLKNNTNDTLHFFFHPKNISPSTGGSLTKEIYYKMYENDTFIEIGSAFTQFSSEKSEFDFDPALPQKERDSLIIVLLAKKLEEDPIKLLKIFKQEGTFGLLDPSKEYMQKMNSKRENYYHTLLPNQTELFKATFKWNKNRYYYHEPNEFYLEENAKHYLELTLVALKDEFKGKIDAALFEKISTNPKFIKGVFVSNKIEINFKLK